MIFVIAQNIIVQLEKYKIHLAKGSEYFLGTVAHSTVSTYPAMPGLLWEHHHPDGICPNIAGKMQAFLKNTISHTI